MRAFVAVDLTADLRDALARAQEGLAPTGSRIRWVAPSHLHLTLKFLGDVDDAATSCLRVRLRAVAAAHAPLAVELAGLGAFPPRHPRAVWAGCRGDLDGLARVASAVADAAAATGVARDDRPFSPHVTLGRVGDQRGRDRLRAALAEHSASGFGRLPVDHFTLYRSDLSQHGPRYTAIEVFPLSGPT
jgi:2'-5' RNA ligase